MQYVVIQQWNDGSVNQGRPRMVFGPFSTSGGAENYRAERESNDPRAEWIYSAHQLIQGDRSSNGR